MGGYNNFSLIWGNGTDRIYRAFPGSLTTNKFFYGYLDPSISYDSEYGVRYQLRSRVFFTDNNNSNDQANQALNTMADLNATGSLMNTGVNFTAGLFLLHTKSEASLYAAGGSPNNTALNTAGYLQLDRKFFQKLIIQGGLRVERFSINDNISSSKPVFRGGLNYEPWKGTNLRASIGQGYRYPTITERFIQTSAGGFNVFPNPEVQPESSTAAEVGLRLGFKLGKWLGFLDAAGFNQRYYNTIEYIFADWEPGASGFKFVNTGNTEVEGLEITALAEGNFTERVEATFFATYTFIKPRTRQPNAVIGVTQPEDGFIPEQLTYINTSSDTSDLILKYRFRHMFKYDIEFRVRNWTFGVSSRYYSFMENIDDAFYSFDLQENPSFPDGVIKYREENNNGTWVTDARLGFSPNIRWKFFLVANNVANLEYSLRPMKIESPGTIALQISFKP
jgi:iron complex outermembrane receptor protein